MMTGSRGAGRSGREVGRCHGARYAVWLSVVLLTVGAAASLARAADPFYLRLLRQGSDAYNRRDFPTAVRQLRIAVFGLLDEPKVLADGLVRLGLAQIANGDPDGFTATFQRVVEIEERFQAYSEAEIPADSRNAFEKAVLATIPRASLQSTAVFARLIPKPEERIAQLPIRQRRRELEALLRSEPREIKWPLMLAELELADGNAGDARAAADAALHIDGANPAALRVRGLANLAAKHWSAAAADLRATKLASSDATVAAALLRALIEERRFKDALDEAATLPESVARARQVQDLARRAAAGQAAAEEAARPTPTRTPPPTTTPRPSRATLPTAKPRPTRTLSPTATPRTTRTPSPTATTRPTRTPPPIGTTRPAAAIRPLAVGKPAPMASPVAERPAERVPSPTLGGVSETPTVLSLAAAPPDIPAATGSTASPEPTPGPAATPAAARPVLPPPAARAGLRDALELAARNRLPDALAAARKLADAFPDWVEAQHATAELAYRQARWSEAVTYFQRGGDPGDGQPLRLFYLSVSLFETGDRAGAATAMKRCIDRIRHNAYVDDYAARILARR